jgi:lipoyl(octanoyl) transferase
VWAGGRKVAAVGVRVSRGVATHGLALNVASSPLLAWFRLIDPCGLGEEVELVANDPDDDGVTTSLWRELRKGGAAAEGEAEAMVAAAPTVRAVAADVAHALAGALGVRAVWPGQEGGAGALPPLPPEAARAVLEGVAGTAAALERRAPPVPPRPP